MDVYLTFEEKRKIYDLFESLKKNESGDHLICRDHLMIDLMVSYGVSLDQVLSIKSGDVRKGVLSLKGIEVPLREYTLNLLVDYLKDKKQSTYLFPSSKNPSRALAKRTLYDCFKKLRDATGIAISGKILKKTFVYQSVLSNIHPVIIMRMTEISSKELISVYDQLNIEFNLGEEFDKLVF